MTSSQTLLTLGSNDSIMPLFFLFLEQIKGRYRSGLRISWCVPLFGNQQSWKDTSCALQIGLLWYCLLNRREVIHILTKWIHERSRGVVLTLPFWWQCVLKSLNSVEIALIFQKTSKLSQKYMSPLCEKSPKKETHFNLAGRFKVFFSILW